MRRLWRAPGVAVMVMILAIIMAGIGRRVGPHSPDFLWSLLICLVVAALALTLRWWSSGPRRAPSTTVRLALKVKPRLQFMHG